MRCPKCGAEMIYSCYDKTGYIGKKCIKMHFVPKEELDKMEAQARLDKVLSKFKKFGDDYLEYDIKATTSNNREWCVATILYTDGKFNFGSNSKEISLDTVESLLKDMEEQK